MQSESYWTWQAPKRLLLVKSQEVPENEKNEMHYLLFLAHLDIYA